MELDTPLNPKNELGQNNVQSNKKYKVAIVDSLDISNYYEISVEYKKQTINIPQQTPQGLVQVPKEQIEANVVGQGWK